jgi:hypothetical protein
MSPRARKTLQRRRAGPTPIRFSVEDWEILHRLSETLQIRTPDAVRVALRVAGKARTASGVLERACIDVAMSKTKRPTNDE